MITVVYNGNNIMNSVLLPWLPDTSPYSVMFWAKFICDNIQCTKMNWTETNKLDLLNRNTFWVNGNFCLALIFGLLAIRIQRLQFQKETRKEIFQVHCCLFLFSISPSQIIFFILLVWNVFVLSLYKKQHVGMLCQSLWLT